MPCAVVSCKFSFLRSKKKFNRRKVEVTSKRITEPSHKVKDFAKYASFRST